MSIPGGAADQARALVAQETWLHVPAILGAEVASALRALVQRGELTAEAAYVAARRTADLRAHRYPFEPFLERAWELRHTVTVYDAWYVALAEALGATLVTADERLARASGPRCPVLTPIDVLG